MSNETDRMLDTSMMIDNQSNKLIQTNSVYGEYGSKIKISGKLTKQLKETHKKNRIRVYGSFYFFLAVVAYIWLSRMGIFYIASLVTSPFYKLAGYLYSVPAIITPDL